MKNIIIGVIASTVLLVLLANGFGIFALFIGGAIYAVLGGKPAPKGSGYEDGYDDKE